VETSPIGARITSKRSADPSSEKAGKIIKMMEKEHQPIPSQVASQQHPKLVPLLPTTAKIHQDWNSDNFLLWCVQF
jgi:hypothetical protein